MSTAHDFPDGYAEAIRDFIARRGRPVEIIEGERERAPDDPSAWVCVHGWLDQGAYRHCRPLMGERDTISGDCHWVVPAGVHLTEVSYSQFADTNSDNDVEVGINVASVVDEHGVGASIDCACGKYRGVTLRWVGTLGDVLREITGSRQPKAGWTL